MHKLITSDNRQDFDDKVRRHLSDGWSVLQGTMYATVVNVTKEERQALIEKKGAWEDNLFIVFLQGDNHQMLVTSPNHNNFDTFVNNCLSKNNHNDYTIIPGTIYAVALSDSTSKYVTPYISVTLQKW